MTHDPRWKNPQEGTRITLALGARHTRELRKGDYLPATLDVGDIAYDNTTFGLSADNVQDAIDENDSRLDALEAATPAWTLIAQNTSPGTVSQVDFNQAAIATMTELLLVWEAVTVNGSLTVSTDGGSTFADIAYQNSRMRPALRTGGSKSTRRRQRTTASKSTVTLSARRLASDAGGRGAGVLRAAPR